MRIGALSQRTGLQATAIRFYETNGVLPPPARLPSGYRDYTGADEERIRFLQWLRGIGLSMDDLRSLIALRDNPRHPSPSALDAARRAVAVVDERIDGLAQVAEMVRATEVGGRADPTTRSTPR